MYIFVFYYCRQKRYTFLYWPLQKNQMKSVNSNYTKLYFLVHRNERKCLWINMQHFISFRYCCKINMIIVFLGNFENPLTEGRGKLISLMRWDPLFFPAVIWARNLSHPHEGRGSHPTSSEECRERGKRRLLFPLSRLPQSCYIHCRCCLSLLLLFLWPWLLREEEEECSIFFSSFQRGS